MGSKMSVNETVVQNENEIELGRQKQNSFRLFTATSEQGKKC